MVTHGLTVSHPFHLRASFGVHPNVVLLLLLFLLLALEATASDFSGKFVSIRKLLLFRMFSYDSLRRSKREVHYPYFQRSRRRRSGGGENAEWGSNEMWRLIAVRPSARPSINRVRRLL